MVLGSFCEVIRPSSGKKNKVIPRDLPVSGMVEYGLGPKARETNGSADGPSGFGNVLLST